MLVEMSNFVPMAATMERRIKATAWRLFHERWRLQKGVLLASGHMYRIIDATGRPKCDYMVLPDMALWWDGFMTCAEEMSK